MPANDSVAQTPPGADNPRMSNRDLEPFLREWAYEPGRVNARMIETDDGTSRLQVRLDLGVLQMRVDGRPDGEEPEGAETLLDLHLDRLRRYVEGGAGSEGFVLSAAECRAIREEAVQIYHRYVAFFALGEYELVMRDTRDNLRRFDLCRDHGHEAEDRMMLEQFRPPVTCMFARAEAESAIARQSPRDAIAALDRGLDALRSFFEEHFGPEAFERAGETQLLRGMRDALVPRLPASQRAELEERLRAALDAENYELAAILRDELRMMR
ncbi:MAG: UvrB/UvrC motif-containing protein [Phycisphaerales bacterium]